MRKERKEKREDEEGEKKKEKEGGKREIIGLLHKKKNKEILARAILGDNLNFGGNFNLRGGSVRGTTCLPDIFFLTFFYYSFI